MRRIALVLWVIMLLNCKAEASILLDRVVAIVNKEVITWSDLYRNMEFEALESVKNMSPQEKKRIFKENEHSFLETMIDMKLQLQEAERRGMSISKEEVNNAIEMIRSKYGMTGEDFQKAIAQEGFQLKDYQKKLAEQMLLSRIVDQEVRSKIIISEEDVDRAIKNNSSIVKETEGYVISILTLSKDGSMEALEAQAVEILERLKKGESFAELARQYSADPSAKAGGALGFVNKTDISPQLMSILEGLKEQGISEPFRTDRGVSIVMLHQKREIRGEKELREAVRQKLAEEGFNRQYKNWIKSLRERSYVEIKI